MSEQQIEQYITRAVEQDLAYARGRVRELQTEMGRIKAAVEQDLAYARGRVRELQTEMGRIKAAATRVVKECDVFLTGKQPDEDAF